MSRSLAWQDGRIHVVDQRSLPDQHRILRIGTADELIDAITTRAIHGAAVLGLAGAMGVALSAAAHTSAGDVDAAAVRADARRIAAARPLTVNLARGVERALTRLDEGAKAVLAEAHAMIADEELLNRKAARRAADYVLRHTGTSRLRILTHCNTGCLATGVWGTALGTIRDLHERGHVAEVLATETRPLLQGARLTVWELQAEGIPVRLCADSAAASALRSGDVDCVIVGADRIAANGDVASKIGTYPLALAAARRNTPFVVVTPESTVDESLPSGDAIRVEQRDGEEVTSFAGRRIAPEGTVVYNPALDITPYDLVSAVVTERGVRGAGECTRLGRTIAACTEVVPDHPVPGVDFQDLSGVYRRPGLLRTAARELAHRSQGCFTTVVGVEARGFVLAAVLAAEANVPLVLARKSGRTPGKTQRVSYRSEYAEDALEVPVGSLGAEDKVLVVDDVLATGGTLEAVRHVVEACGAQVTGYAVLTEIAVLNGASRLAPIPVESLHVVPIVPDREIG